MTLRHGLRREGQRWVVSFRALFQYSGKIYVKDFG